MNGLDKIKARAADSANRSGRPVAILNLNRAGAALYVIRDLDPTIETCAAYVCTIQPDKESAQ